MILYVQLTAPHRWVEIDRDGRTGPSGTSEIIAEVPVSKRVRRIVGVVPGEHVGLREVQVPARNRAKALSAIPYILEDNLATDVEDLFFALLRWDSGRALVAVVEQERMRTWCESARSLSRPIDAMLPDYLLLPAHPQARYTVAVRDDGCICVRGPENDGMCLDRDAIALWWRELKDTSASVAVNDAEVARDLVSMGGNLINQWDIGHDFVAWLQYGGRSVPDVNLLQGDYAPPGKAGLHKGYRVAAAILLGALVLRAGVDAFDYFALGAQESKLDQDIVATMRRAFPAARVVRGAERTIVEREVKQALSGQRDGGDFQYLLGVLARAIRPGTGYIEDITYRDSALLVSCTTRDFAALDRLRETFSRDAAVQVQLMSSGARDNRVTGRFKLELRPGV